MLCNIPRVSLLIDLIDCLVSTTLHNNVCVVQFLLSAGGKCPKVSEKLSNLLLNRCRVLGNILLKHLRKL